MELCLSRQKEISAENRKCFFSRLSCVSVTRLPVESSKTEKLFDSRLETFQSEWLLVCNLCLTKARKERILLLFHCVLSFRSTQKWDDRSHWSQSEYEKPFSPVSLSLSLSLTSSILISSKSRWQRIWRSKQLCLNTEKGKLNILEPSLILCLLSSLILYCLPLIYHSYSFSRWYRKDEVKNLVIGLWACREGCSSFLSISSFLYPIAKKGGM